MTVAVGVGVCLLIYLAPYLIWVAMVKSIESEINKKDNQQG